MGWSEPAPVAVWMEIKRVGWLQSRIFSSDAGSTPPSKSGERSRSNRVSVSRRPLRLLRRTSLLPPRPRRRRAAGRAHGRGTAGQRSCAAPLSSLRAHGRAPRSLAPCSSGRDHGRASVAAKLARGCPRPRRLAPGQGGEGEGGGGAAPTRRRPGAGERRRARRGAGRTG